MELSIRRVTGHENSTNRARHEQVWERVGRVRNVAADDRRSARAYTAGRTLHRPSSRIRRRPITGDTAVEQGGRRILLFAIVTGLFGAAAAVAAIEVMRSNRRSADAAAWILVSNVNTLLRLDLDHLTGDDENAGLRELRTALKEAAVKRPAAERKLFERFNALVGVAIAFGEKVHDANGNIDLRAVANRRAQLQNALVLGDRLEAAL